MTFNNPPCMLEIWYPIIKKKKLMRPFIILMRGTICFTMLIYVHVDILFIYYYYVQPTYKGRFESISFSK